jgi:hypothetical protein
MISSVLIPQIQVAKVMAMPPKLLSAKPRLANYYVKLVGMQIKFAVAGSKYKRPAKFA